MSEVGGVQGKTLIRTQTTVDFRRNRARLHMRWERSAIAFVKASVIVNQSTWCVESSEIDQQALDESYEDSGSSENESLFLPIAPFLLVRRAIFIENPRGNDSS